ncbi:heavy-metal-associated domain-containing protein [Paracoccus rhizosphaerae]|uniref:Heavy-metal-associated domain-containing protein n=1 Tax=Paracoccus rhizosphaerae TaxID=1133347 RepID=A0ABV6CFS8_9RHOB|nr:heavy-metal-associated domain-containing protein [Paracoccus rhizosphaerae]
MRFHIPNMNCGGCARSVTRAIQSVDANARITIEQASREIEISTDLPRQQIVAALAAAGYPAAPTAA